MNKKDKNKLKVYVKDLMDVEELFKETASLTTETINLLLTVINSDLPLLDEQKLVKEIGTKAGRLNDVTEEMNRIQLEREARENDFT